MSRAPTIEPRDVRVIGHRWSPHVHELKAFLARSRVAYRWLDIERDDDARAAAERASPGADRYPIVVLPDGSTLVEPDVRQLAEKLGLETQPNERFYDLVIVGGGENAPDRPSLVGAGVYYGAATAEASALRGQDVYILGGGNSAGQAAMLLAEYARRVVILALEDSLEETMSRYLMDRIRGKENVDVRTSHTVARAEGSGHLEALTVRNVKTDETERVAAAGLFIFIGGALRTDWLADAVERDEKGFIVSGLDLARRSARCGRARGSTRAADRCRDGPRCCAARSLGVDPGSRAPARFSAGTGSRASLTSANMRRLGSSASS